MKVDNIKRQGNLVTFEVEDEYNVLDVAIDKKYRELAKKVKISGFRPGKVPKGHFINYYGFEHLSYEALIDLLNEVYPRLVDDHYFEVIDSPSDIQIINLKEGEPFRVAISVQVRPEIKIKNYKGIRLEKPSVKVNKEDVQQEIQSFLESNSTYVEDEKASVSTGDLVTVDMKAGISGVAFDRWTKIGEVVRVGGGVIDKKFDDQLIGTRLGDQRSFQVTFPDDETYNQEIAGKTLDFDVTVKLIKVKKVPKLDDALVSSKTEFKSADDYRKSIEEKARASQELAADNKVREDLAKWIVDNIKEEIPEPMIKREVDFMVRRMEIGLRQYNLQLDAYLNMTGKSLDVLRKEYYDEGLKSVKYNLGLEAIAKFEKIDVLESDIQNEIEDQLKLEQDEEKRKLLRTQMESMKDTMRDPIQKRKVVDWLLENAKIKKK
jgi:trigger factor